MSTKNSMKYYLIPVFSCVEPALLGPFATEEEQGARAKLVHKEQDEDDALFWLDVAANGTPFVGTYLGGFFEEAEAGAAGKATDEVIVPGVPAAETADNVEISSGIMQWDNADGTIRYIDNDGDTEDVWRPEHADYAQVKAAYFSSKAASYSSHGPTTLTDKQVKDMLEEADSTESSDTVQLDGDVMQWDRTDGTIRCIDSNGNCKDIWKHDDPNYSDVKADYFPDKVIPGCVPFGEYCARHKTDMDKASHRWPMDYIVCSVCGQPDDCGDCDHTPLPDQQALELLAGDDPNQE